MPVLRIVRGLPGSGKSTMAKTFRTFHLEGDMYHMKNGKYDFQPNRVGAGHKFVFNLAEQIMSTQSDIVISNTFTQLWEFEKYLELAEKYFYTVIVYKCIGKFKNIHSVPEEVLEKMKNRWEDFAGEVIV